MEHTGRDFINETVRLDGGRFVNCTFHGCTLLFGAEGPVAIHDCRFEKVKWTFDGPAKNTLKFLAAIYHGMGEGGRATVEATFEQIREGKLPG